VDTGQPEQGGVHHPVIDIPAAVGHRAAVNQRILAKAHADPESRSTLAGARSDQRNGFAAVAAVVAASVGVTASLVWGLHLLHPSPRSISVVPVDGSRAATRINH